MNLNQENTFTKYPHRCRICWTIRMKLELYNLVVRKSRAYAYKSIYFCCGDLQQPRTILYIIAELTALIRWSEFIKIKQYKKWKCPKVFPFLWFGHTFRLVPISFRWPNLHKNHNLYLHWYFSGQPFRSFYASMVYDLQTEMTFIAVWTGMRWNECSRINTQFGKILIMRWIASAFPLALRSKRMAKIYEEIGNWTMW